MILDKLPNVQRLSPEEKWELIDDLWQQLLPPPDHKPRPEIVASLEARMEQFRRDPSQGAAWAEAKARLRAAKPA